MRSSLLRWIGSTALLAVVMVGCDDPDGPDECTDRDADTATMDAATPEEDAGTEPDAGSALESPFEAITVLTFDAAGTLYVADSGDGRIHALTPPDATNPTAGTSYNLRDIDATLAALLGTTPSDLRVRDLAVHPTTSEAYIAIARPVGDALVSAIAVVNQAGEARLLETASSTSVTLPFAPADDFRFYNDFPSRDLSITDLTIYDGRLYVAGMSNADFASTLWTVPLPFDGEATVTTVEIYHGVHGQTETRAPIRTMTITEIDGEPTIIAAYTCTPLVTFPVSAIVDGAHVTGRTIAELGYGNTPGDMEVFDVTDMTGSTTSVMFLQNLNQGAQVIPLQAIAAADEGPGINTFLGLTRVDLGAFDTPMSGMVQLADQDPRRLLAIRRDAVEGDLELVSYLKGAYFRLSDFQSEYEVPDYVYPPEQDPTRQFQNMMKVEEGQEEFVVE